LSEEADRLFRSATGFEWDAGNATKSWDKHRVSRGETEEVFFNAPLLFAQAGASEQETRYFVLGCTDAGRRLFVVFTLRGTRIRVISARDMSRSERSVYSDA
jgi:hypothetical protein